MERKYKQFRLWEIMEENTDSYDAVMSDNVKLFTSNALKQYIDRNFANRLYTTSTNTLAGARSYFHTDFEQWWTRKKTQFEILYSAITDTGYNPLENYDRISDISNNGNTVYGATSKTMSGSATVGTSTDTTSGSTTVGTHTDTVNGSTVYGKDTVERSIDVTDTTANTTTANPSTTTNVTNSIYGDNSTEPVPSDATTTTQTGGNITVSTNSGGTSTEEKTETASKTDTVGTTSIYGAHTDSTSGSVTHSGRSDSTSGSESTTAHTDTNANAMHEHTHGNIGVTSVPDMLTKELQLRTLLDLEKTAMVDFIDSVSYYVTGVNA